MDDWLHDRAKTMRREPALYERRLWAILRDRRLEGLKFRRQVVIGRYVADFVCLRHRLIVEADGPTTTTAPRTPPATTGCAERAFACCAFPTRRSRTARTRCWRRLWRRRMKS
jgi:hypothetical protein